MIVDLYATNSGLEADQKHHRSTSIGLNLLPAYQGKGYGSEAIRWALEWAFEEAGMHRVAIQAFEYNEGARRLYERLGFVHEGTLREAFWHRGRWWADYEYGMLEDEWRAKQAQKERTVAQQAMAEVRVSEYYR